MDKFVDGLKEASFTIGDIAKYCLEKWYHTDVDAWAKSRCVCKASRNCPPYSDMVFQIHISGSQEIGLAFDDPCTTNIKVEWGDDSEPRCIEGEKEPLITTSIQIAGQDAKTIISEYISVYHKYKTEGTYTIRISSNTTEKISCSKIEIDLAAAMLQGFISYGDLGLSSLPGIESDRKHLMYFSVPKYLPHTIVDLSNGFRDIRLFDHPNIIYWNTSNVTNMSGLFRGATSFNRNIGRWNISNVRQIDNMFNGAENFNQYIGRWDVSNVVSTVECFSDAISFNQDISRWNVSGMRQVYYMFNGASSFKQNLSKWRINEFAGMGKDMFKGTAIKDTPKWYKNRII